MPSALSSLASLLLAAISAFGASQADRAPTATTAGSGSSPPGASTSTGARPRAAGEGPGDVLARGARRAAAPSISWGRTPPSVGARGPGRRRLHDAGRTSSVSPAAPAPLPAPESDEHGTRVAELAAAPHEKVDFVPEARAASGVTGSAGLGVAVYATPARARPSTLARRSTSRSTTYRSAAPASGSTPLISVIRMQTTSPPRFRPGSGTELYLWDAEISHREIDWPTVLALGRIWPWHTPGLPILDGVQLGRRNESGTARGDPTRGSCRRR